jgi:uncharacterized pyridoxal phosphate-containing UPF0001 family protein
LSRPKTISKILAISKITPLTQIEIDYELGKRHFCEYNVDEFSKKADELIDSHPDITWHFIGNIQ